MTKDLTQGSPVRLILGFALPLLAGMLFQQLYNLVDTLIVGRFLGMEALAGVGATGSINFLVLGFCMGVCSGFAIPVAQQFGAREESRMREFVANGTWLSIVFALVMTVLTVAYCADILRVMNTPTDCFEQAYDYIVVIFAGIPFTFLYNLLSGWLRSLGDSKTPLFFLVLSSVLNVILDLAFILIFKLGVFGASLATVLSQAISGVLCLLFIMVKVPILHITRSEWRPQSKRMTELCAYGVPMGLQYSITAIGSVILQASVNELGSAAVASVTAGGKVNLFFTCPFDALGGTMATWAGQNVGAGKPERVHKGLMNALLLGAVYSVLACAFLSFFGKNVALLFLDSGEAEILTNAQTFLRVNSAAYLLLLCVNVFRFCIQGMGYSLFAILAGVFEMVARSIMGFGFVPKFGFFAVCFANPLAWLMADLFLIPAYALCLRRVKRRTP